MGSEADSRVSGVLSDFASVCAEDADPAERATFFSTLANNQDLQAGLLDAFAGDQWDDESLPRALDLLLKWSRHIRQQQQQGKSHLVFQFLPSIIAASLALRRDRGAAGSRRRHLQELEAFLLSLHNQEAEQTASAPVSEQVFSVPTLVQSSVYHDGNRLAADGGTEQDRVLVRLPQFKTIPVPSHHPGAGFTSRMMVVESLYRLFNSGLGDYSKAAVEKFVKSTQRLLQRGYGSKSAVKGAGGGRVHLTAPVLVEMLHGAYFSIYNGFQVVGAQIVELIRQRGSSLGSPQVLVAVSAVRTLILTSGPSHLPSAASISTPSQIAKNLITNASFRAKKISDDIVKVQNQELAAAASSAKDPMASNLKALANMSSISEEVVEDLITGHHDRTPAKSGHHQGKENKLISKDKLKVKLPNLPVTGFKKRVSESDSAGEKGFGRSGSQGMGDKKQDKKRDKDKSKEEGGGGGLELKPLAKALSSRGGGDKKKSSKTTTAAMAAAASNANNDTSSTDSATALMPSNGNSQQQQQPEDEKDASSLSKAEPIESMEQVEALIQQRRLPAETITIHSPESGTTIF